MTWFSTKNLPPRHGGLPFVGATIQFALDAFGFIERESKRHGSVFSSRVLGRNTVFVAGPRVTKDFADERQVERRDAMPGHLQQLFGGACLPLLDGDAHASRKRSVLAAFSEEALSSYLSVMQEACEYELDEWAEEPEVASLPRLQRLALEVIARNVVGVAPGALLDSLLRDYELVIQAMGAIPVPLPGFPLHSGLRAKDRIFREFATLVREHRASAHSDGLSGMLAAEGGRMTDEEAVLELHHIHLAGYVVFAWLAAALVQLARHPELRDELEAEVRGASPSGPIRSEHVGWPLGAGRASDVGEPPRSAALTLLDRVVLEIKRTVPVVPTIFGRATGESKIGGYDVPRGWTVAWAPWNTSVSPEFFEEPKRFDPDRYAAGRAEHERHAHAFVPQGAGPMTGHQCAGTHYSTVLMKVFLIVLLRGYRWELPPQDLEYDWRKFPPEPRDGLRVRLSMRS